MPSVVSAYDVIFVRGAGVALPLLLALATAGVGPDQTRTGEPRAPRRDAAALRGSPRAGRHVPTAARAWTARGRRRAHGQRIMDAGDYRAGGARRPARPARSPCVGSRAFRPCQHRRCSSRSGTRRRAPRPGRRRRRDPSRGRPPARLPPGHYWLGRRRSAHNRGGRYALDGGAVTLHVLGLGRASPPRAHDPDADTSSLDCTSSVIYWCAWLTKVCAPGTAAARRQRACRCGVSHSCREYSRGSSASPRGSSRSLERARFSLLARL